MKPIEVGFDGAIQIQTRNYTPICRFARSNKGIEYFDASTNNNINGKLKNTFIWLYEDENNPELLYRAKDGKLYMINFEPFGNKP